ncbi:MAG: hypothetical protein ACOY94_14830 [Bacillota bacterium]
MLLRYHLRTLFSPYHLALLPLVAALALLWPAGSVDDQRFLQWALERTELLGPLGLMPLVAAILQVEGRTDERWGIAPTGLGGLFIQRWLLVLTYYAAALGLFLAVAGSRIDAFPFWRTFLSALVTAALFSLVGPLVASRTGSAASGWAAGLAIFFGSLVVAQFWCPHDSVYQLWLPFAGVSDAGTTTLALSKGAYAGLTLLLLGALHRSLLVPERLIGRAE